MPQPSASGAQQDTTVHPGSDSQLVASTQVAPDVAVNLHSKQEIVRIQEPAPEQVLGQPRRALDAARMQLEDQQSTYGICTLLDALNRNCAVKRFELSDFSHASWNEVVERLNAGSHPVDVSQTFIEIYDYVLLDIVEAVNIARKALNSVLDIMKQVDEAQTIPIDQDDTKLDKVIQNGALNRELETAHQTSMDILRDSIEVLDRQMIDDFIRTKYDALNRIYGPTKETKAIRGEYGALLEWQDRVDWVKDKTKSTLCSRSNDMLVSEHYLKGWAEIRYALGYDFFETLTLRKKAVCQLYDKLWHVARPKEKVEAQTPDAEALARLGDLKQEAAAIEQESAELKDKLEFSRRRTQKLKKLHDIVTQTAEGGAQIQADEIVALPKIAITLFALGAQPSDDAVLKLRESSSYENKEEDDS